MENNLLDSRGEPFIKLLCPHCEVTCKTFRVSIQKRIIGVTLNRYSVLLILFFLIGV